ncbi:hypothetical protein ACQKWADRAFT_79653 [Trichoderma austrokoningii]
MSGLHFGICIDDRSTHPLLDEYQNITDQDHHRALLVRVAVVFVLLRRLQGPATHLHPPKRRPVDGSHSLLVVLSLSLRARINLPKYLDMASQQQEIRLRSSAVDRSPVIESATRARTTTFASSSSSSPGISRSHSASSSSTVDTTDAMLPPPLPRSDSFTRGRSRASPSISRHKNRLSLTLPVALQLADGTRLADSPAIVSASALASSVPQTPLETPASVATSPSNANEFIIAIAAQERRVLELKEELAQAEVELAKLKKQWASEEVYRKRSDSQRGELFGSSQASIDDDALVASRRSVELDRRKQILHGQTTPAQSRRKVMRGGHARTLSLLSPVRTESVFSLNEVTQADPIALPTVEQRTAQLTNPTLSKRSSWQPRSQQQSVASVVGVPSIVEDFKLGFRAFVEDIRQITVGDEPVHGQLQRPLSTSIASAREQDTSKPNHDTTTHTRTSSNEGSSTATSTSPQANRTPELKPRTGRGKQFSWTPLGFDSVDDADWSNWDSPVSAKSARWSGSTVNSSGIDDIPEKEDEEDAKPPRKSDTLLLSPALEDLLPSMVHHLSPSNLKRTANNLMDEWEKSLVAPESRHKQTTV